MEKIMQRTPGLRLPASATWLLHRPSLPAASVCVAAACGATTSSPGYTPSGFSIGAGTQLPYRNTLVYMSNLTLEKEFAGNVLGVGFVAEPVRNLGRTVPNIATNVPTLGRGGCGVTTPVTFGSPCLPYSSALPLVGTVQLLETNGISNYTALQVTLQRRFSRGLTVASNYTFSRSLSDVGSPGGACTGCAQVLNDFGRDYGPSDYMVKHRFTFAGNYELPFGRSLRGVAGQAVKGWQINGIYAYATGQPFTVLDGSAQQNSFGVTTDRPSAVGPAPLKTSSFARQCGCSSAPRPSTSPIRRHSARNATIGGFDGNGVPTQSGNFAKITTMNAFYTPRDMQFALKLIF